MDYVMFLQYYMNNLITDFSTFDADDFYHKFFQANDISSRSGIKKKGSRGTDYTISSVDSGKYLI